MKKIFGVFVSWSIGNFPLVDFFYFLSLGGKAEGSISRNIRKAFFWSKNNFFNIRTRKFHFQKYNKFLGGWICNVHLIHWNIFKSTGTYFFGIYYIHKVGMTSIQCQFGNSKVKTVIMRLNCNDKNTKFL